MDTDFDDHCTAGRTPALSRCRAATVHSAAWMLPFSALRAGAIPRRPVLVEPFSASLRRISTPERPGKSEIIDTQTELQTASTVPVRANHEFLYALSYSCARDCMTSAPCMMSSCVTTAEYKLSPCPRISSSKCFTTRRRAAVSALVLCKVALSV